MSEISLKKMIGKEKVCFNCKHGEWVDYGVCDCSYNCIPQNEDIDPDQEGCENFKPKGGVR